MSHKLTLIKRYTPDQEAGYNAALRLVATYDANLETERVHYRNRAGVLLTKFDEVIQAALTGDLMMVDEELERAA